MVNWFRRSRDGNYQGEHKQASRKATSESEAREEEHQATTPLEVEPQTAEDLVDRTPEPEEPADGFSEAGIREALRDVRDPEIGRDLISLNMIRNIVIEGGKVTVGVALTTAGCPLKHRIMTDIRDRLVMIEGVKDVEVDFGVMTDTDRQNLLTSLHGGPSELAPAFKDESKTRIIAVVSVKGGVGEDRDAPEHAAVKLAGDPLAAVAAEDPHLLTTVRALGEAHVLDDTDNLQMSLHGHLAGLDRYAGGVGLRSGDD